jgi:serine/threonine-protein kinase
MSAERGTRIPITRTPDVWEYSPRWSPDGRRVAFSVGRGGSDTIDQKMADGSGAQETLARITPFELVFLRHWMREGILFMRLSGGLFRVAASPESKHAPLPGSGAAEINGRVSPDGRWLAYTSSESGRNEVYVRPLEGGAKTSVSIAGGAHPQWHRNGTELYFQAPDGSIMASSTRLADRFEAGVPTRLFSMRPAADDVRQSFSTVDGQRFLVRVPDAGTPPSISWLVNWPVLLASRR